jgi:PGF-CTERM protein
MRRRAFLRWSSAVVGAGTLSRSAAAQDGTPTPTFSPRQTTPVAEGTAQLGRLSIPDLRETVTAPDGRTAHCATTDGFAIVDLTDPANPTLLVDERDPLSDRDVSLFDVFDVKLDAAEDLLAVVAPANPTGSDVFRGLLVYDVSDPSEPERVTVHETEFFNHNCVATDGLVYLCGNTGDRNGVVIVDARSGDEVGRWSLADRDERWGDVRLQNWVLHDVFVHGDVAYLPYWDAGTVVLDVSDPTAPAFLARLRGRDPTALAALTGEEARDEATEPPGNDHYAATNADGTLLGIGVEAWDADPEDDEGGPGGITLYDVSDPAAPAEQATIDPPPTPDGSFSGVWTTSHNFAFRGDRLYTSWYRGGIRVYDVADPSAPELVARWRDSYGTSFWTAEPATEEFFVAPSWKGRDDDESLAFDEAALYTFRDPAAETSTTTDGQPGFGPVAGLAGLAGAGAAAWRTLRRDDGG